MELLRLSFSLRTLLIVPVVLSACLALNLRAKYPIKPDRPISSNRLSVVFLKREYGWPWSCIQAESSYARLADIERIRAFNFFAPFAQQLDPDWDVPPDDFANDYRVREIFWGQLAANIAVAFAGCIASVAALNWWSDRHTNTLAPSRLKP